MLHAIFYSFTRPLAPSCWVYQFFEQVLLAVSGRWHPMKLVLLYSKSPHRYRTQSSGKTWCWPYLSLHQWQQWPYAALVQAHLCGVEKSVGWCIILIFYTEISQARYFSYQWICIIEPYEWKTGVFKFYSTA